MRKSSMEIARLVQHLDEENIAQEIFSLVKQDKEWLGDIVLQYCEAISPEVASIRQFVYEFHNPFTEEEGAVVQEEENGETKENETENN